MAKSRVSVLKRQISKLERAAKKKEIKAAKEREIKQLQAKRDALKKKVYSK